MASTVVDGQMVVEEALVNHEGSRRQEVGPALGQQHIAHRRRCVDQGHLVVAVMLVAVRAHLWLGIALLQGVLMTLCGHHGLNKQQMEAQSPDFQNLGLDLSPAVPQRPAL